MEGQSGKKDITVANVWCSFTAHRVLASMPGVIIPAYYS